MQHVENLLVGHRGENGWTWLEAQCLTDDQGVRIVTFHADSFSPFVVAALSQERMAQADIRNVLARQGGGVALTLTQADGTPPEAGEDGVYTVQQEAEYALNMRFTCPAGLENGAYVYRFPENVFPVQAEGPVYAADAQIGAFSANGETGEIAFVFDAAPADEMEFTLDVRLTFLVGAETVYLDETLAVRSAEAPGGPVSEQCVGENWKALQSSGYFSYWSDRSQPAVYAAPELEAIAPQDVGETLPSDSQVRQRGGETASDKGDGVKISKTIQGTELENVFDITLTVKTPTEASVFFEEPDIAVVIVMDISNTMNSNFGGKTRYTAAMDAACQFIDSFAANNTGRSKIGYVAFNTDAHQVFGLQSCSNDQDAARLKKAMSVGTWPIISQNGYSLSHQRFTNVEGGLKMARDMLSGVGNEHKYIIFLSDGFPTTYVSSGYNGYDPYKTDGGFYDNVRNKPCYCGTDYSDTAAIRAREMASDIKSRGIKIFSVGVAVGDQTIKAYSDKYKDADFSTVDRRDENYEIGSDSDAGAYKRWLGDKIGSGYDDFYYDSTDASGLEAAYGAIFQKIKHEQEEGSKALWVTTDAMPQVVPETVEFIGLYDREDALQQNSLIGESGEDKENTASYSEGEHSISWDLKKSGYTAATSGGTTIYSYTLRYRVRLKNEEKEFAERGKYDTNGLTSLTYRVVQTDNGKTTFSEERTLDYPIPAVEGYLAELEFKKVDGDGQPVAGAEFTLSHDTEKCGICRGDGESSVEVPDITATSDKDGMVRFERIPSGHIYRLTETAVPGGYRSSGNTYTVQVAYDQTTVTVQYEDGNTVQWDSTIVNQLRPRLPETGGSGVLFYTIGGIVLMAVSLLYGCASRRRRERRQKN